MTGIESSKSGGYWSGHHIDPGYSATPENDLTIVHGEQSFEQFLAHRATRTLLAGARAMRDMHLDPTVPDDYEKLITAMQAEQAKGRTI